MKKFSTLVLAFTLTLLLALLVPGKAEAAAFEPLDGNMGESSYQEMFDLVQDTDGAATEYYAAAFSKAFQEDRERFLSVLAEQDSETVSLVTGLIVAELDQDALLSVQAEMNALSADSRYATVSGSFAQAIEKISAFYNAEPSTEYDDSEWAPQNMPFEPRIVKQLLSFDISRHNLTNEMTCAYACMIYEYAPRLFAHTFMDYPAEDIAYLASLLDKGYTLSGAMPPEIEVKAEDSEELAAAIRCFQANVKYHGDADAATAQEQEIQQASGESYEIQAISPSVGTPVHPATANLNETISLSVSIMESSNVSSTRVWYVKVCAILDGDATVVAAQSFALVPGKVNGTFTCNFQLTKVGDYDLIVYVYESANSTTPLKTVVSKTGIEVKGDRSIDIYFYADRDQFGTFGCARVSDSDQLKIQNILSSLVGTGYHNAEGEIVITKL